MLKTYHKRIVAAAFCAMAVFRPAWADGRLDELLRALAVASAGEAQKLDREVRLEWDRSGSASADLLLKRGREALERGEADVAAEHLTALTDHAPEFAQGWVERAKAYLELDLYGPALGDLETALALNPQHYEAILGLAMIFEALGREKEAWAAYEQVKAIHPHHPDVTGALQRLGPVVKGHKI